ncbi:MAG: FimB/Mfa2 family fimbrial subunit [Bacteroidales bacterium]|nr:FimB/Mfa2 family fimbrial subunit [Bacteroidales bacterium]
MNKKTILLLALATLGFSSCKTVFEDQRPCDFKVKFVYDYNMKFADAAANEIDNVTLYAFDEDGEVAWQGSIDKAALDSTDYAIKLPLEVAKYNFVAWANGKQMPGAVQWQSGKTKALDDMSRHLPLNSDNSLKSDIVPLFHGSVVDEVTEYADHIANLHLVKNTNSIQVILQQTAGAQLDFDEGRFQVFVTADNSAYDIDNEFIPVGSPTRYDAWDVKKVITTKATVTGYEGLKAEMTVPRLRPDCNMRLQIVDTQSDSTSPLLDISLVDVLLLVRKHYSETMPAQEFLDRQDEFSLIFFLDEGSRWIPTHIYVNSWKVVLQDSPLL